MNIQLNQAEICNAIKEYLANQGIDLQHKVIGVALTAGRGSNGHSANVNISESTSAMEADTIESDLDDIPFPEND